LVLVPGQQVFLSMPLRHAIANSATTICFTAAVGATYKVLSLGQHGYSACDALRLAGALAPTAVVAGYIGGRLAHRLPRKLLRLVFVIFMSIAAVQTFRKAAGAAGEGPGGGPEAPLSSTESGQP
jgi:uncharacterized membrane protein YfcA